MTAFVNRFTLRGVLFSCYFIMCYNFTGQRPRDQQQGKNDLLSLRRKDLGCYCIEQTDEKRY